MFCARALMHITAFVSVAHAALRCSRFGALLASSSSTWRSAKSQSGCLSYGSLLTIQWRQSAIRQSYMAGRPTAASASLVALASQRTTARSRGIRHRCLALEFGWLVGRCAQAVTTMVCRPRPKSLGSVQNAATTNIQGSAAMAMPRNVKAAGVGVFSTTSTPRTSLTVRSSRRQYWPWLRHFYGQYWYPTHLRCSGAAYLGR
jgi:hypothetical protein